MQRPLLTLPAPEVRVCVDCGTRCLRKRKRSQFPDSFCVVEMHSGDALCEGCYLRRPPRRFTQATLERATDELRSSLRLLDALHALVARGDGAREWRQEIEDAALSLVGTADELHWATSKTCVVCGCPEITDSQAEDERHFVAEELCEFCIGRRDFEGRLCGQCDTCSAYVVGLIIRPNQQWAQCLHCFKEEEPLRTERRAA